MGGGRWWESWKDSEYVKELPKRVHKGGRGWPFHMYCSE